MTTSWEFTNSFFTTADRKASWNYWSDMRHHAEMESVQIELDGPFQSGTKGRTITDHSQQEWELNEVVPEKRFVIVGQDDGFELSFGWDFEDEGQGTRMTQTIRATGPEQLMQKWSDVLKQMERTAPNGMELLKKRLDALGS